MKKLLFVSMLLFPILASAGVWEEAYLKHALTSCRNARKNNLDGAMLHRFLDIEKEEGVPLRYRGLTVARACQESGYNPNAKGDCWDKGKPCRAFGIFQLWPWTKSKVNRLDPEESVRFYLRHIGRHASSRRLRSVCPRSKDYFYTAWMRVNKGGFVHSPTGKVPRCLGGPKEISRLRSWRRAAASKTLMSRRPTRTKKTTRQ